MPNTTQPTAYGNGRSRTSENPPNDLAILDRLWLAGAVLGEAEGLGFFRPDALNSGLNL